MLRLIVKLLNNSPRQLPVSGFLLLCALLIVSSQTVAKGVYQTGPEFIAETFTNNEPVAKILWLNNERKQHAKDIMGHTVNGFRVRYWQVGETTAWILEEIGKELPITIGVVIDQQQIKQVKILTYRESRGGEVRFPRFLSQFVGGKLDTEQKLTAKIDGVTGATLSVRAVKNISRLVLYYHQLAITN